MSTFPPPPPPGTIGDGTDYDWEGVPSGTFYWAAFANDRTRKIVGVSRQTQDTRLLEYYPGHEAYLMAGDFRETGVQSVNVFLEESIHYAGYDWRLALEPVNQWSWLNPFREHAARFAHQLDDAMGHHTLQSADEPDRLTTFQTLSDMIGSAWRQYREWEAVDPTELIVGGNYDGTPLWRRNLDEYALVDDRLCGECEIATFARRFLFNANLPLFRRLYRQGIIYGVNRTTTPKWEANIMDVATQPHSEFYVQLVKDYHAALTHYDMAVAPRAPTVHERL